MYITLYTHVHFIYTHQALNDKHLYETCEKQKGDFKTCQEIYVFAPYRTCIL